MSTTTDLNVLKLNYLSQAQYDEALANSQINENELYLTPISGDEDTKVTQSAAITTNSNFPLLLSYSASTSTAVTNISYRASTLNFNPSTVTLNVGSGTIDSNINMSISTSDTLYTTIVALGWDSDVIV